jgi:hypothetical protein
MVQAIELIEKLILMTTVTQRWHIDCNKVVHTDQPETLKK